MVARIVRDMVKVVDMYDNNVGDPTSTRDWDISLYISGCKPHLMSRPVLWGWVRLKAHFLTNKDIDDKDGDDECGCNEGGVV